MNRELTILGALFLSLSALPDAANAGGLAAPHGEQAQCLQRIMQANCPAGKDVQRFILSNVDQCRHMTSANGNTEMEVLLVKESHHLVLVQTKGAYHWPGYCRVTRYDVAPEGIRDFKVINDQDGAKAWLVSNTGKLYCLFPNEKFFEVMNGDGNSYQQLRKVEPIPNSESVKLVADKAGIDQELSTATLNTRGKRFLQPPSTYWSLKPISAGFEVTR
jgi:hypothetical protein